MRSQPDVFPSHAGASAGSRQSAPLERAASARGLYVVTMAAVLMAALSIGAAPVQQESAEATAETFSRAEIARALETVKADPNLATERTIKMLRWKDSTEARPSPTPAWVTWTAGLFRWLDQSARLLVWGAVAVLAGLLFAYVVRTVRTHGVLRGEDPFVAPTHVRDLDIRPESLPEDIGIAARVLWDRGEHRAALALLYRGMLSRLAHVHRIPIRDSTTESDCLALAASHLTQGRHEYASRLVRVWQRFVYGGQDTQAVTVYVLCDDFASALDSGASRDAIDRGGAA